MSRCGWDTWKNTQTTELKAKRKKNWKRTSEIYIANSPAEISLASEGLIESPVAASYHRKCAWPLTGLRGKLRVDCALTQENRFDDETRTRKPDRHRRAVSGRNLQKISLRHRARRRRLGLHHNGRAIPGSLRRARRCLDGTLASASRSGHRRSGGPFDLLFESCLQRRARARCEEASRNCTRASHQSVLRQLGH